MCVCVYVGGWEAGDSCWRNEGMVNIAIYDLFSKAQGGPGLVQLLLRFIPV